MEFYLEEEEYGKCRKHPSQSKHGGVCPICLKNRLSLLCPDCANVRPCACCAPSSSSCSSSSSLSSSEYFKEGTGIGAIGRVSYLIDSEPSFRRSRSAAFPFLRQGSISKEEEIRPPDTKRSKGSFLLSFFKVEKTKKRGEMGEEKKQTVKMSRSRSVGPACYSDPAAVHSGGDVKVSGGNGKLKGRSWYFPSPIKVFRQPKTSSKIVQERSPLCLG